MTRKSQQHKIRGLPNDVIERARTSHHAEHFRQKDELYFLRGNDLTLLRIV